MKDLITFYITDRQGNEIPNFAYILNNKFIIKRYNRITNSISFSYWTNYDGSKTLEELVDEYTVLPGIVRFSPRSKEIGQNNIGKYYERIYRKGLNQRDASEVITFLNYTPKIFNQNIINCKILLKKLNQLFEVVTFNQQNFDVFGHEIRNVLLLSCMEVEASWNGILTANNYISSGRNTTNDYFKLNVPLQLNEYKIVFNLYPDINPIIPFEFWSSANPTSSLFWYDNYNKTKHDRENNENLGTLISAVNSVSAAIIMLYVQFGPDHSFWDQAEFGDIKLIVPNENLKDYYIPEIPQGIYSWQRDYYNFQ